MNCRSRLKKNPFLHSLPTLPFLSVMLGLMSVMALTTIGISVEHRQIKEESSTVELVGIPSDFIPFYLRCKKNSVMWLGSDQRWRETSLLRIIAELNEGSKDWELTSEKNHLLEFITEKVEENKLLSFSKQQNSMILWVEPEGIDSALILQHLISVRKFPLRVGLLPILEDEEIFQGVLDVK